MVTSNLNLVSLKDELNNYLRYFFQSTDPNSRLTETTQTFNGDDSTVLFTPTNSATLAYVAWDGVEIGGVKQDFGTDWTINWRGANAGTITFTTAPTTGTNNVSIKYGYGSSNMVYPDYPRNDLGVDQYPRIGFLVNIAPEIAGMGGTNLPINNTITITLKAVGPNTRLIDSYIDSLLEQIKQDAKQFYNINFINPVRLNNFNLTEDPTRNIIARIVDLEIRNRFEIITYSLKMEELTKQILEGQGRYEDLRRDMEKVFEKYGLRPLEIYRLANELQARSFEMFINAMDNFIEERMNGVKK